MSAEAGPPRLGVRHLSVSYGVARVVRDVSLEVAPGEAVALLGRNGAGKTSSLLAIAGAIAPAAGSVEIDGSPVQGLPAYLVARRGLSLVPQGRRIFPTLTVRENLTLGQRNGASVQDVLQLFPILRERARALGSTLSGGQQQMLAIARALMTAPRLLLMDEPSEGLAPLVVQEMAELVKRLRSRQRVSILLAEQNLRLALAVCDRVYVLERGEMVYGGPAEAFAHLPDLQRRYLGVGLGI